ncbi:trigger factor [Limosilactobacillus fermentum]|uniref:Trigger factor n=1 Tax=Limosilactobacillus fermentum TaxID=1613 RepID=A0ABD0AIY2_LIMFE|nr:trigger factor [Limosilactobacillus fermentum]MBD9349423.1 trigger factor [Limosilactobacillus fermentum]PHI33226.1 trigger factor [Limosilactobacillus fermentum]CDN26391.1 K03545 trigger factor [Limosilactobacillus fermentum]SJM47638.1 Cell division trigger factor [Limosilactobacillus fermentum]SJM60455.1 Cell division trigger factor [Limosilactobacillus fermentum]
MSVKWERDSDAPKGTLTFDIDTETIQKGIDHAFTRTQKRISVPGFRKGHVPRTIFNQMYGEESLYQDALNDVLPDAYEAAIKEAGIEPVDQPQVNVESMEKGQPWTLTATVAVKPEVTLGDYKGMEVPEQDTSVSDADVDSELEKKRQQQAELVLKEDEAAADGDTVVIDYEGTVDGEKFDGGSADNYSLVLGSGSFIPGFEDQLVGHKADEDVDVNVTFPEDYHAKDLAGKDALFKVKIHEVKEKQLPELDDEFAKDVDEDVETLAELKDKVKKQLQDQKEAAAKAAIEDAAIEAAVANAETEEIPQAMLDDDTNRQLQQYLAGMQQQGINPQMYFQITNTTEDDLRKQFADDAAKRVKTNLVLEAVVKDANLNATDEDVQNEIADLAKQYGMDEEAVSKALTRDMLEHDIEIKKAVDLIADSAKQTAKAADKD